jgi:polyisoprenoid-binding protein YceI
MKHILALALLATTLGSAVADTYTIEPSHTYPSFEADHFGVSVWRGKFTKTSGSIVMDRSAKSGSIDITVDTASVDFGHAKMNEHAKSPDIFDVAKFPTSTFKGKLKFDGDTPVAAEGDFTLHGVSKPMTIKINKFKCIPHPFFKKEVCGADASAEFKRSDFGVNYGLPNFSPEVKLLIQVEAVNTK